MSRDQKDQRQKSPDWQVTAFLPGDIIIETDCNSGEKRKLGKSKCICGQPVLIQLHGNSGRRDGKRVFYPDEPDTGRDAFRCKTCLRPVAESVPGAEHETPANQNTAKKRQCHW